MDGAGISWRTAVVGAIATACRRRMFVPAVNVAMSPVPRRRLQRPQRLREAVLVRRHVVMALVIPPRLPPPEHRRHPIPVLVRADIAGAQLARLGN